MQSNLQVSISHTNELGAAIAFPEVVPMGIDTELICDTNEEALEVQMTPKELNLPNVFPNANPQLTLLWTVKEALSKVLRCGLLIPFELLEVKSISKLDNFFECQFVNFSQYKAHSFFMANNIICSLVYPSEATLAFDDFPRVETRKN